MIKGMMRCRSRGFHEFGTKAATMTIGHWRKRGNILIYSDWVGVAATAIGSAVVV